MIFVHESFSSPLTDSTPRCHSRHIGMFPLSDADRCGVLALATARTTQYGNHDGAPRRNGITASGYGTERDGIPGPRGPAVRPLQARAIPHLFRDLPPLQEVLVA